MTRKIAALCVLVAGALVGAGGCLQSIDMGLDAGELPPADVVEDAGAGEAEASGDAFDARPDAPADTPEDRGERLDGRTDGDARPTDARDAETRDADAADRGEGRGPTCACTPPAMEVRPLETVSLSGSGCTDPDGDPLTYHWSVSSRPPGSTSQPTPADARDTTFFVDMATTTAPYAVRVTAESTDGYAWCEVLIYATASDALHVDLVWDKDITDVDLHLLNPAGSADPRAASGWFNTPNDCFYLNRTPDWGTAGTTDDNPRIVIDDVSGFGPEAIDIASPAEGTYTIGAHYFCAHGLGPSTATIRVFCNGTLAAELGPRALAGNGVLWEAATVAWPSCTVTPLGRTFMIGRACGS